MITEPTANAAPPEIYENIENVHAKVEALQRELVQAMEVWNQTIGSEKEKFESLLAHKDMAAKEQDAQWASQSSLYEARLAEMKAEFETRLSQAEQNATRSLAELDDAWQRDKLEWGPAAQSAWPTQRQELEAKVQILEAKLALLENERSAQASQPQPTAETVEVLEQQLQSQSLQSDEMIAACVRALDDQITVLYDLISLHATPATSSSEEATDLAQPQ